ncbi:MAG: SCP-like extracellular [Alphaproteobacteria bacterium]|nr:SCP-like extracellular [Alphaproteobacteria bacterium]MBV9370326.1 SCP-like extracellular [Alphaproteobacteria bacterium]MBV9902017.1 SCP-like extracellular [Alphaproteobacteria bacterium]
MAERRQARRAATLALALLAAPLLTGASGRLTALEPRLLAAHNAERAALGLKPLEWDATLAADAAGWARHLARIGDLQHAEDADPEDPQGENLWAGTKGAYTPEAMVGLWIAEKKDYRPAPIEEASRTGDFEDIGHYTQLVWRDTGRVGCALAAGAEDEVLVCRYRTAGNVEGERAF